MRYGRNRRRFVRYNRRRGVPIRKFRRRYNRKRRYGRRRSRYTVTPYNKKQDTIQSGMPDSTQASAPISEGAENTFFLFCPTFLPGRSAVRARYAHERSNSRIHFTGYREKVMMKMTQSVIWRRIVVWSHERVSAAKPPIKGGGGTQSVPGKRQRNILPQANTEYFREWLFQGTQGIDYTTNTIHQAPINRSNVTVSYDRTSIINPNNAPTEGNGKLIEKKFWNPGGLIKYDDDEAGSKNFNEPGWSARSGNSKGNMYIVDIFTTPGISSASGVFQPQGTTYWVEP